MRFFWTRRCGGRSRAVCKLAVLLSGSSREILVLQGDARVLEGSLRLGNGSQEMNFAGGAALGRRTAVSSWRSDDAVAHEGEGEAVAFLRFGGRVDAAHSGDDLVALFQIREGGGMRRGRL